MQCIKSEQRQEIILNSQNIEFPINIRKYFVITPKMSDSLQQTNTICKDRFEWMIKD